MLAAKVKRKFSSLRVEALAVSELDRVLTTRAKQKVREIEERREEGHERGHPLTKLTASNRVERSSPTATRPISSFTAACISLSILAPMMVHTASCAPRRCKNRYRGGVRTLMQYGVWYMSKVVFLTFFSFFFSFTRSSRAPSFRSNLYSLQLASLFSGFCVQVSMSADVQKRASVSVNGPPFSSCLLTLFVNFHHGSS